MQIDFGKKKKENIKKIRSFFETKPLENNKTKEYIKYFAL